MNDYISRRAYIKEQCNKCDGWCNYCKCDCLNCKSENRCDFIKELAEFPTADVVEQKHGKWIPHPNKESREWDVCTVCRIGSKRREYGTNPNGTEYVKEFSWPYCPNCGSRMDGES